MWGKGGKPGFWAALWLGALILNGCAGTGESARQATLAAAQPFGVLQSDAAGYRTLAAAVDDEGAQFNLELLAVRSDIVAGAPTAAAGAQRLAAMAVTPLQADAAMLVDAARRYRDDDPVGARGQLQGLNPLTFPVQMSSYYHQLAGNVAASLFKRDRRPETLLEAYAHKRELVFLLTEPERTQVTRECTELLGQLSPAQLVSAWHDDADVVDRGFFEYVMITVSRSPELRAQLYADLARKYAAHPVTALINGAPASAPDAEDTAAGAASAPTGIIKLSPGARVAVLLPLSGRFAAAVGEPARQGVLAALQERRPALQAVFYDTNQINMSAIASRLRQDHTALVIGPILKPEITAFNAVGLQVPSVALNRPEQGRGFEQWYFDLGPEYEGALAAAKIYADGHRLPLVIGDASRSASRAMQGFERHFGLGGTMPRRCVLADDTAPDVGLGACAPAEADAVYMYAPAAAAVRIKGALPQGLPVYLTDTGFDGFNNGAQEMALKGVLLGDMPWLLYDSPMKQVWSKSLPPAQAQAQKIFAAAYDSVALATSMEQLAREPQDVLHGLTGDITLGIDGLIETSPLWVTLGEPRHIAGAAPAEQTPPAAE